MKVLTCKEVQELLNISEKAAYKLLKEPNCPRLKTSRYRIIDEDLINWLRKREKPE